MSNNLFSHRSWLKPLLLLHLFGHRSIFVFPFGQFFCFLFIKHFINFALYMIWPHIFYIHFSFQTVILICYIFISPFEVFGCFQCFSHYLLWKSNPWRKVLWVLLTKKPSPWSLYKIPGSTRLNFKTRIIQLPKFWQIRILIICVGRLQISSHVFDMLNLFFSKGHLRWVLWVRSIIF